MPFLIALAFLLWPPAWGHATEFGYSEIVKMVPSPNQPTVQFETTFYEPSIPPQSETPVVVINHGTADFDLPQPRYRPLSAVRFFTSLGMSVVVPNRQGYGKSTGSRARIHHCDLAAYAMDEAKDIDAFITYLLTLPNFKGRKLIVVGQSTGGLASMAYSSLASNHAAAILNFHGGVQPDSPGDCRWEARVTAFKSFAKTSHPLTFWLYTANDHSSNPPYIARLYKAFTEAGGHAELHQLPDFGEDGHFIFGKREGESIWEPLVLAYLKKMGIRPGK